MVMPWGSIINAVALIIGGSIGMLLGDKLSLAMKKIVFQGLGLCTLVIGFSMAMATTNPLYMVGSVVVGGIIGEMLQLESSMSRSSDKLKKLLGSSNSRFTEGFVTATLLFCIGSMAILGPLQEGLDGVRTLILTKTTLDFFASIALGAAFGSGVVFSALPLVIYQGSITLFAESLRPYMSPLMRTELGAVGGVLIIGIGLNILEITEIRLSSFLPALVLIVILCLLVTAFPIAIS